MQADYPPVFERDMGCTEAEWLHWLPGAIGDHPWRREGSRLRVDFATGGRLELAWTVASPRVIALIRLPRLLVQFRFDAVDDDRRYRFMKRFDLYMQRGGG